MRDPAALNPIEQAILCERLSMSGLSPDDIAHLLRWTAREVRQRLALGRILSEAASAKHGR
jgi:DNA-directed RNA polymerase specialized sigma24 family protein